LGNIQSVESIAMNIHIFSILRKINKHVKRHRKQRAGQIMSPVRRIEQVAPLKERVCAMTFDDGPTAAPCIPAADSGKGLTAQLLDILARYNAKATFDVVGSTADNYPDTKGALHSHFVFGNRYDHYPAFGQDDQAGVLACPELLKRMVDEGHEIANHGYSHRIFGAECFVYRRRAYFKSIEQVMRDLQRLHTLVKSATGYEIKLSRPPHYIDGIGRLGLFSAHTAYTAYARMGYHYMAANVDGGGWYPTTGDYAADMQKMVTPLADMLESDPNSLNGAVIFQKDGYNMSMQSPVADALALQLKLLYDYGYQVVGVEELVRRSPFEDVAHNDECLQAVRGLEQRGYVTGFRNNTFKPDEPITREQLAAMMTLRGDFAARRVSDRKPLSADDIQRQIAGCFGDAPRVRGNTRRSAAMALWEVAACMLHH
jgi:peptidoglycan/xylan/chitin deacetylase (PgdA/CDA1 family)